MSDDVRRLVDLIANVARTPNWSVEDQGDHWMIRSGTGEPAPGYRVRRPHNVTPHHLANILRELRRLGWTPQWAETARRRARRLRVSADRLTGQRPTGQRLMA